MQGQAAVQGSHRPSAGPRAPERRGSSKLVIGVAGALLTAAAISGAVMMMDSNTAPVTAPTVIAQTSTVAPAITAPAPVVTTQAVIPNFAPPVTAPPPAPQLTFAPPPQPAPAPALNLPRQCELGQLQQLTMDVSATKRMEVGNVIVIHSGSYVSPPILITRSIQRVTFPAPPGSNGYARIFVEQKTTGGWTFQEEANGVAPDVERQVDSHHDIIALRWTPSC